MARYSGSKCRLCRREGLKLMLKGERCFTDKCAFERRDYAPGMHKKMKSKLSDYGRQLREKQKVKRIYELVEGQFKRSFFKAERMKGIKGETLLLLLERRLDNIVYRTGFAHSRSHARQMVNHSHFMVNDKKVTIPSYLVKVNDVISVKDKSKVKEQVKLILESQKQRVTPKWIEVDRDKTNCKLLSFPERSDITMPITEQSIVELYSK